MSKALIIGLLFSSISAYGQNLSSINKDFGLPDSLTNSIEIRVYKSIETTNYNSLFRLYLDENKNWLSELHEHWAKVGDSDLVRTQRSELSSLSNLEYIYTRLLSSYIFELPDMDTIKWKLEKREGIDSLGVYAKAVDVKYLPISLKTVVLDGSYYSFQAINVNKKNSFKYGNPERYIKIYPEVDELIFVVELISIIREEFGIWEK